LVNHSQRPAANENTAVDDGIPEDPDEDEDAMADESNIQKIFPESQLCVPHIPPFRAGLINELPLVTDLGTALSAFVSRRHIDTLCNRLVPGLA
jgi:hypothetical protein